MQLLSTFFYRIHLQCYSFLKKNFINIWKKTVFVLLSTFLALGSFSSSFGQGSISLSFTFDNCASPPQAGTYNPSGTQNGKVRYVKDGTHNIYWTGSRWEINSNGTVTHYNNSNTTKLPCGSWSASFGCYLPNITGDCVSPPTKTTIPGVSVYEGAENTVINLESYFDDDQDGASGLTYTKQSTDGSFFTASINGSNQLIIDFGDTGTGTSTITIRATDSDGDYVDGSFSVTASAPPPVGSIVIDFEDQGFIDGQDYGSKVYIEDNFKITYPTMNWGESSDGEGGTYGLFADGWEFIETDLTIEMIDGSEVDFISFYYSDAWGIGLTSVKGYKDGALTGTQSSGLSGSITLSDAIFDDVDKVVITSGSWGFLEDVFDNFVFLPLASGPSTPTITTTAISTFDATSATLGGNVTDDGGASVTERGVVYSSSDATPEIGESGVNKDPNGTGTGAFSESITGLSASTTYYVRSYAINSEGTSYGNVESFTTTTPAPDINVKGNSTSIADGDNTPSTIDHTDFGSVSAGSGTISKTFTIENTGTSDLNLADISGRGYVSVSGTNASDFTVSSPPGASTITPGNSTTFTVEFDPSATGDRNATVNIGSNDTDETPYTFVIKGTGTNTVPTATSVSFSGTLKVDATLTGSYTFSDTDTDPESGSTYKWYRSDDASGTNKAAIATATAKTYTVQVADAGKYISFEVTPNDGTDAGTAVESSRQQVAALPTLQFSSTSSNGAESVNSASLQVDLSATSSQNITVDYTISGTATGSGTDYTLANGTLTITTGNTSNNITIAGIVDDAILEANETVIVTLSNPSSYATLGANTVHTYTINNNDNAAVTIADVNGNEDDGAITVTATLDNAVQGGFTVDVSTSNGTATAGSDYTAVSGETLTFAGTAGETQTFTVTPTVDTDVESDETLTISQSNLASTTLSVDISDGATVTINDDDVPQITAGNGSVTEGDAGTATISFEVRMDRTSPGTITVDYETEDGTATAGSDYTAKFGTLTFTSGQTTKTVDVVVNGDEILEANEFFRLNLSNVTGSANLFDDSGTGTITNDDAAVVTIADVSGNEDDGSITVTATLDYGVQGGFEVDVSTADGTATTGDSDYTAVSSQTLTFTGTAGETQTFTVTPTSDTKLEADETLTISQSNLFGTALGVDITDGATVTIDNDDAAAVTIADVSGNEDDGAITVTATLDNAVQGGFTVDVSTSNGTATAGSDYTAVSSQTLTFVGTAGETQTFTVTPTADGNPEISETISVSLSNLAATSLGVDISDGAVVTINDDDASQISIDDPSIAEGESGTTNLDFTLSLDKAGPAAITVDYATADNTAEAGSDYIAVSGTVTFAAGETSKTVSVVVSGEKILEADESFNLNLSNVSGIAVISDASGTGTIINDDAASVTIADISGNEDDGTITVSATLDNGVQGGFTVDVSTADGTATTGDNDYTAVSGQTLTFTGTTGETQTFIIPTTEDTKLESDETLAISQSNLTGTALGVNISDGAIVTITNDDAASVTIADISGNEDDGSITVTATLGNAVDGGFTVDVSITDGTAIAGTDYTAVSSQTLTFTGTAGEAKTFTVTPTADTEMESDETLTVSQSNLAGTALGVDISDDATVTITNDDNTPVITASQNFSILEELANGTSVGTVQASDADAGTTLQNWLISGGNTDVDSDSNPAFVISSNTGEITVNDSDDLRGGTNFDLTITVSDGVNTSASEVVTMSIGEVNDVPTFTQGGNQTILEDAGSQIVDNWATNISAGPADESGQSVTFTVSNDNNALFSVQPAIAANGTLTYTSAADANGTATVTVSLSDDGGTGNGGEDTSDEVIFTITVSPVNDVPFFTAGSNPTIPAGAASHHLSGWAKAISAGPANESSQQLTFLVSNDNNDFFTAQPAINSNGDLSFTLAEGVSGQVNVTVSLSDDGGTANGGDDTSDEVTFTINIGKLPQTITFTTIGDKMVGQDPIALTATGGDSGLPVTYTITTNPASGVATLTDHTIVIENVGTVTVTASQEGNALFEAADNVSQTFTIAANELFLPTLFTPNGDGNNDRFILRGGGGVASLSFSILDRDNNLVYRTTSWKELTEQGWDGVHNGKAQPLGTYVWVINGKYTNGLPLLVNGKNTGVIRLLR